MNLKDIMKSDEYNQWIFNKYNRLKYYLPIHNIFKNINENFLLSRFDYLSK